MKTPTKEKFWTREETRKLSNEFYKLGKKEALEDELKFLSQIMEIIQRRDKGHISQAQDMIFTKITEIKKKLEDLK